MPLRDEVQAAYDAVRALDTELAGLRAQAEERVRRQDFLAFQRDEIDEVELEPGEIATLSREHAKLAHAESLCADGGAAAIEGDNCEGDVDKDGVDGLCGDGCPLDEFKLDPGQCGCGNGEFDTDGDGRSDCADNCIDVSNPSQADTDNDFFGDICDCAVNDAANPPPREVQGLTVVPGAPFTELSWQDLAADSYDVASGLLSMDLSGRS